MQQFKFIIPQKLEDLLHPQEDPNIFYVNDELTSLEVAQKLPDTESQLRGDPLCIADEFGVFFSVLKNFNDLDPRIVDRTWTLVFKTTDSLKEQLRDIFSVLNESLGSQSLNVINPNQSASQGSVHHDNNRGNLFESLQEKLRYSNGLKMLIYINCTFIQLFEDALSSQNHRQNFNESYSDTTTPAAKRKKKRQRNNDNGCDISFKDYERYNERVMKNLLSLISMPFNKIFDSPTEARDIVGQIMRVCYKMIENSEINGLKQNKDLLDINFAILGCGIDKYQQSLSFCLKFIQLLQYKEKLAPMLAGLVEFIVIRHDQRLLIGEILREIDRIDVKDLSRDSSCPRAVSTFLEELSEKCPQEFIPFLNHMFGYLEQDSYIMRNASLLVIKNLITKVLHTNENEKTLRNELLDVLLAHVKDITGHTRSKALSQWCSLCKSGCIPLTYIEPVTNMAVGRLLDKSCWVRKYALELIISILCRNPYHKKLPLQTFLQTYQKERALLNQLIEEEREKIAKQEEVLETLSQSSQNDTSITSETDPEEIHPCLKLKNLALAEESAVITQRRKVTYLQDTIQFTRQIHRAIPYATDLLYSKNITDIQGAIEFFVTCHEYGIDEALVGFKRMILLINVQEKSVKDTVSNAYKRIFFESSRYEGKSNRDALVITNFINFIHTASIGECLALEVLIGQFIEKEDFTKEMKDELWARFTRAKAGTTPEESIGAIQVLGMLAVSQPDVINHNLQLCTQYGLSSPGCSELESRLVRETCIAIRKSLPRKIEDKRRSLRLARDDEIFVRLETILVESLTNLSSDHWYSMCDEALRVIFDKAENPEKICESIFNQMVEKLLKNAVQSNTNPNNIMSQETNRDDLSPDLLLQPSTMVATGTMTQQTLELVHPITLARFVHFLGGVALDLAVYLELHVLLELKVRNAPVTNENSANNISAHNISISSRRRSRRYGNRSLEDDNLEDEIGLGGAEAEDAELEFIGTICDEEIVCGKNLLAKLSKVIVEIVRDPFRFPDPELKQASSLTLAKFMMVSAKHCHDHLRLLFTILEKTKDREIKINLLIAISDLCIRFPNQLDAWTGKIFDCLQSDEVSVRRAALKILSRLVLCDILKAKDQISTMANLIVDDDEHISSYSRHFFLELSKKLNAIYNVLPDIISRLSDSKTGISVANFRIVMKFMFDLIDKSQHIDRLVDKLCGRFMDTDDERHWSDLAYCLSLLKYSDKSMCKLFDKFDCYKDKLCIDSVHESFALVIANYRKTPHLKNEMKQLLDEFEARIAKSVGEEKENSRVEGGDQPSPDEEQGANEDEPMDQQEKPAQETNGDDTTMETPDVDTSGSSA